MNTLGSINANGNAFKDWAGKAHGGVASNTPRNVYVPKNIGPLVRLLIEAKKEPLALAGVASPNSQTELAKDLGAATILHGHDSRVINLHTQSAGNATNDIDAALGKRIDDAQEFVIVTGLEMIQTPEFEKTAIALGQLVSMAQNKYNRAHHVIGISSTVPGLPFGSVCEVK